MGVRSLVEGLLFGPSATASSSAQIIPFPLQSHESSSSGRSSWVFDTHVMTEAQAAPRGKGALPQSTSLAFDDNAWNSDSVTRSYQGLTARERKEVLLSIYLNNPWVSACVDVIAKRITSGGLSIEPTVEKPNEANLKILETFALRVNDDWDMLQYVRASIVDELIFGDTYTEIVWQGGKPFQLYKIDGITMSYKANRYGSIDAYMQQMDSSSQPQPLDPKNIVRWWFPHPRAALDPFSPIERVQDAVLLDKKMINFITTFFQKGAKFPYYVKFKGGEDEAERYMVWHRVNHTGEKNAHLPPVTWGDAELVPTGKGSVDIDFDKGLDRMRGIVLTAYHVPPAAVGIIESGNIGGGTGEDQEKSFQYNTCDPIRHTFFEKFNYRVVQQGFGITDYRFTTRYADYRSDETLAKVQDMHIRNGSITINEARAESGKTPFSRGGDVPVIVTSKEVTPVPRLDSLENEQAKTAQQSLDAADLNNQLLKAKVDQANTPPEPVPAALQGQPPPDGSTPPPQDDKKTQDDKQQESLTEAADLPIAQVEYTPPDVTQRLQAYRDAGTQRYTWKSYPDCCDLCKPNDGETRNVGESFPNGAILPQCHNRCQCIVYPEDATPEEIAQIERDSAKGGAA